MKTYRGSLLAAAVLLATLPLTSCGDADDYAQTAGIALTSSVSSVVVKGEVVFTVTASFPDPTSTTPTTTTTTSAVLPATNTAGTRAPVINQCDPALEYQVSGAGIDRDWTALPGTLAVRTFILKPREVSPLVVIARGKCIGSMEDWKYSTAVNVTVTDPVVLGLPALTLVANPTSVTVGNPVTFNLSSDKPVDCTVRLKYQYSGAGFGVTTVDPATAGQFILTPSSVGTLTVTATGWCTQKPAAVSVVTTPVTVTATPVVTETITTPATPTGNSPALVNNDETYVTAGATSSTGDTLEYQWSSTTSAGTVTFTPANANTIYRTAAAGGLSVAIQWSANGSKTVMVRARCVTHPTVFSPLSSPLSITIP